MLIRPIQVAPRTGGVLTAVGYGRAGLESVRHHFRGALSPLPPRYQALYLPLARALAGLEKAPLEHIAGRYKVLMGALLSTEIRVLGGFNSGLVAREQAQSAAQLLFNADMYATGLAGLRKPLAGFSGLTLGDASGLGAGAISSNFGFAPLLQAVR